MTKTPESPATSGPGGRRRHSRAVTLNHLPAQVRQSRIVELVRGRGFVSVPLVADEFQVSEMTIRRDLAELEQSGRVVRTHGGAIAPEAPAAANVDRDEPAFDARLQHNREVKDRIAAAAAEMANGCKTVALDVGTTTYLLAVRLLARPNLMLFTNSLRIACLPNPGGNEIFIPGGQVRKDEMSVHGPSAVAHFDKLWFDLAFVGVSGTTPEGIFDYSAEDSEMKRVYLRRSARKVVLCDSLKFGRMSLVQVARLGEFDALVTDQEPPPDLRSALDSAGVEVRVAPEFPAAPK